MVFTSSGSFLFFIKSTIKLARNHVFHAKTKHIHVKYHFIKAVLDSKNIEFVKVHTNDNLTNLLTKGLRAEHNCSLQTYDESWIDICSSALYILRLS